jgi:hypothetical protein
MFGQLELVLQTKKTWHNAFIFEVEMASMNETSMSP